MPLPKPQTASATSRAWPHSDAHLVARMRHKAVHHTGILTRISQLEMEPWEKSAKTKRSLCDRKLAARTHAAPGKAEGCEDQRSPLRAPGLDGINIEAAGIPALRLGPDQWVLLDTTKCEENTCVRRKLETTHNH